LGVQWRYRAGPSSISAGSPTASVAKPGALEKSNARRHLLIMKTKPRRVRSVMTVLAAMLALSVHTASAKTEHERMLEKIAADYRATGYLTGRHRMSANLQAALARVPRHAFVPADVVDSAYLNRPLSIGHGQTISQPFIVALMTDLLDLEPGCSVLEIGTGSGYQAAVLAELGASVYSMEIVAPLAEAAAARLRDLGYATVAVKAGDGNYGWPEAAPFDRIIVTAGGRLPPALLEQLADGDI